MKYYIDAAFFRNRNAVFCVLNYAIEENTFLKFRKKIEKKAAVETFLVFLK